MITLDNIIFFDSDDEFYNFAVVPQTYVKYVNYNNESRPVMDFDLSYKYNRAIDNNYNFIIRNEDSQIYKHGCVNFGCMSKPIKNLKPYFKNFTEKIYDRDKKFFS